MKYNTSAIIQRVYVEMNLNFKVEEARQRLAEDISIAGQLAIVLEVAGYPKPGNVHRFHDFRDTRFEHFLAGGVAVGPSLKTAALRGIEARLGMRQMSEIGLGAAIYSCVEAARRWHKGGNTLLGVAALIVPLAAGAGMAAVEGKSPDPRALRQSTTLAMKFTTVEDAVEFYRAVASAGAGGLGVVEGAAAPDVANSSAEEELKLKGLRLIDVMRVSAEWDEVSREWVEEMNVTFQIGHPTIVEVFKQTGDINIATVHCYLKILSNRPDTLIARKLGLEAAKVVSKKAGEVLAAGGLLTAEGRRSLEIFDINLREDNRYNPGTTADLTAASLMVAILTGLRF
ncbi:MAG: triphosphoribosyl-dephospho-CoA synthase [Candidatus Bathyarchaeia archaeon]